MIGPVVYEKVPGTENALPQLKGFGCNIDVFLIDEGLQGFFLFSQLFFTHGMVAEPCTQLEFRVFQAFLDEVCQSGMFIRIGGGLIYEGRHISRVKL